MKKKRMLAMLTQMPFISIFSKQLLLFGAFLMLCFSGYGQNISIAPINDGEEDGSINTRFSVTSGFGNSDDIDVTYTIGGMADSGVDYTPPSGTVTIPGDFFGSSAVIVIPSIDDNLIEGNETLIVTLTGTDAGTIIQDTATANILDDDVSVEFSTGISSDTEDNGGNLPVLLLNGRVSGLTAVTVTDFGTGTATGGGVDYIFTNPQVVNIPAGDYDGTLGTAISIPTLAIISDLVVENDETINLALSTFTGDVNLGAQITTTYTLLNDDIAGYTLSTATLSTTENGPNGTFTVVLTAEPSSNVVISAISGDTSEGTVSPGTLTFTPANYNTPRTVTVTPVDDPVVDGPVTYDVTMSVVDASSDNNFDTLADQTVSVTNVDDDTAGYTLSTATLSTTENGPNGTFTVVLTAQPASNVVISATSGDTTEGTISPATMTFTPANYDTPRTVTVTPVDDPVVDGPVTYNVTMSVVDASSDNNFDPLPNQNVSVTNADDDSFAASISATDDTATEAGGSNNGEFTVDLGAINGTGSPIVVNFIRSGSATHVTDYANIGTSVSIANNQQTSTVTINPVNDAVVEGPETVILTLDLGVGYSLGTPDSATVNIVDDDSFTATISATDDTATEAGTANNGVFTVDLGAQNGTGSSIVVNYSIGGTAINTTDYANIGTSVSIANNQQMTTVTINPVNDLVVEGQETVVLTLASGVGYSLGSPASATVNIVDNDTAGYTVSTATLSTTENGTNETFAVVLTAEPASNVVISATSDDTTEGMVSPGSLTFTPANYSVAQTVIVSPVDDLTVDGDQTYDITLSVVDASSDNNFDSLVDQTVSVTNADDDTASLSISDAAANENVAGGTLIFNVVLSNAISGGTTVNYTFNDGSATGGGVDYDSMGGSITFDGITGEIEEIIVPLIDDSILEESENFTVQLGTPSNGVIILGGSSAIGTINDDDNCAPAPILDSDVQTGFCGTFAYSDGTPLSLNDYTNSTPPTGTVLTWSTISDPLNTNAHLSAAQVASPSNDGSYFGFFYDAANECASGTIEVELTLNSIPVVAETMGDERCGPGVVSLTVSGTPDVDQPPTFNWYDSMTGGNSVGTGSIISLNISTTTSYYVEASANGCTSAREEVIATIYPLPSAGIPTNAFACNVAANGPTIVDLDDLLTGESTGEWSVTTDPSNTIAIGIGNIVNFENRADGDYIFTYTTTDATLPFCDNVSSDVTISVNDCDVDTDLDGLLDGLEITLGTNPNNSDTDGDGIEDAVEVGDDTSNPLDEDSDGIIDALDSNILDTDMDSVVDQLDPANTDPCIPDPNNEFCVATVDLEIIKTANDDFLNVNEQLTFTITVTNISDISASLIQVEEVLDAIGFEYISHFTGPGDGVYDEVAGLWDIPMLAPSESATLVILVEAISFGVYVNTATILVSSPVDINLENNEFTVENIVVSERSNNDCEFLFNQFSPNGDGTNDFLVINCITDPEYANNSLEIYDRYGNQVYATRGYDNTWAGTRNNNDLPKGTYFYVLDLVGDGSEIRKGWIQIIRQ